MISVLIVDDDGVKVGSLKRVLADLGVDATNVHACVNAADALAVLRERRFDLLLLDVNIPRRGGEPARRGEGFDLLRELRRHETVHLPRYVVGVTAYADVATEFADRFTEEMWTLIHYSEVTDQWRSQLAAKVEYLLKVKSSENFSDGQTYGFDLAFVCALDQVELDAIKALPVSWNPLKLPHDETRYLTGAIEGTSGRITVLAAAAPRMGMPAAAVLASKVILQFRPRLLAMVGICAGRFGKVELGDVVIADAVWDYGSGKVVSEGDQPTFLAAPHQIELDVETRALAKEIARDHGLLERIRGAFPADPDFVAADTPLKVHVGPLASGAAVVANAEVFGELVKKQNRNLLAIEMEAYGVASAARGCGAPRPDFLVAKGISDFADKDKGDDLQAYAAHTSARVALEMALQQLAS